MQTKIYFFLSFILLSENPLYAQLVPIQNNIGELKSQKVKSLSVFYYSSKDTTGVNSKLILKKKFDKDGKITNKYILSLWEGVSYSINSTYNYDGENLIEELHRQTVLNLEKRDEEYINSFGDTPLNEKIKYTYNQDEQLMEKDIFSFVTDEISDTTTASQSIIYQYDSGFVVKEISSSLNNRIFNKNFTNEYNYDLQGNLVKTTKVYGTEMNMKRTSFYIFDSENRMIEEKVIDQVIPRNNIHIRYNYDDAGNLKNKLTIDEELNDFVVDITFEYDSHGNKISGEKDIEFTYYSNGLINSEYWLDPISDLEFYFVSHYQYY